MRCHNLLQVEHLTEGVNWTKVSDKKIYTLVIHMVDYYYYWACLLQKPRSQLIGLLFVNSTYTISRCMYRLNLPLFVNFNVTLGPFWNGLISTKSFLTITENPTEGNNLPCGLHLTYNAPVLPLRTVVFCAPKWWRSLPHNRYV